MDIGDAFLLVDKRIDEHLWVVISRPGENPSEVVIVNLTSHDADKDDACILDAGDHPWIRHRTCVRYMDARIASEAALDGLIAAGSLRPQARASDDLLGRILAGAQVSAFLPGRHRRILQDQDLIER